VTDSALTVIVGTFPSLATKASADSRSAGDMASSSVCCSSGEIDFQ
jgi:hypothetical protein